MKRAFSVFTPMVGTILITITILIVASILQSERFAVAGTLQSYQSVKLANIMREAQGRIEEGIRTEVFQKAIKNSNVWSDECHNDGIVDDYYSSASKCGDVMSGTTEQEVEAVLRDTLAQDSMEGVVKAFQRTHQGEGFTLEYNDDPVFRDALKDVLQSVKALPDGRVEVHLDYSKIDGMKVATLKTNISSINIYLEPVEKKFISPDPLVTYGQTIGDLFQGFTLMDSSWHDIGDLGVGQHPDAYGAIKDSNNVNQGHGDGSEWYHYTYAMQSRRPPEIGNEYIVTGWENGFEFSDKNKKPVVLHEKLDDLLADVKADRNSWGVFPPASDCATDVLRRSEWNKLDKAVYGSSAPAGKKVEDNFVAGFLKVTTADLKDPFDNGYYSDQDFYVDVYDNYGGVCTAGTTDAFKVPLPGGYISDTLRPSDNWLPMDSTCQDGTTGNGKSKEDPGKSWNDYLTANTPNDGGKLTVVDSIDSYDAKFSGANGLEKTVQDLESGLSDSLKASMGYPPGQDPQFNMSVESFQYYTENELSGGDNWYCGEFMAEYVPQRLLPAMGILCAEDLIHFYGYSYTLFLTLPINYTCPTFVLSAVKEVTSLYRDNSTHPGETKHLVYKATLTRKKTDYTAGPDGNTETWEGAKIVHNTADVDSFGGDFATQIFKKDGDTLEDDITNNRLDGIAVRHCTYSYKSGDSLKKDCEWLGLDPSDYHH